MLQRSPEPIRVAFCIDNMQVGGTELNAVRTAERLDRSRYEVRVICLQAEGPLLARYAAAGIPVHPLPLTSLYAPSSLGQGIQLMRLLREHRVDIFHAHDIYSNVFGVPWARLAGASVIASRRWWEGSPGRLWRLAGKIGYRIAHVGLANSPGVGRLLKREGLPSSRIAVVPNFVDEFAFDSPSPPERSALFHSLGLEEGGAVVGIVANLSPVKDHESLLRAAAILAARHHGVRFVLVGDGPCHAALEQLARDLAISDRVVFAGRRSNRPNLHHLFDVSVLCSRSEGFPNSVIEAMAAGRPVVATDVGAMADAVVHGKTGLLVPAGSPGALSAALDEMLSDRTRARRMGKAGQRRARRLYSPDVALGALEKLYDRLAHPRRERQERWNVTETPARIRNKPYVWNLRRVRVREEHGSGRRRPSRDVRPHGSSWSG